MFKCINPAQQRAKPSSSLLLMGKIKSENISFFSQYACWWIHPHFLSENGGPHLNSAISSHKRVSLPVWLLNFFLSCTSNFLILWQNPIPTRLLIYSECYSRVNHPGSPLLMGHSHPAAFYSTNYHCTIATCISCHFPNSLTPWDRVLL